MNNDDLKHYAQRIKHLEYIFQHAMVEFQNVVMDSLIRRPEGVQASYQRWANRYPGIAKYVECPSSSAGEVFETFE
jgi:hypothetical protein